ncbi:MAG: GTPase Era [Dehalococcoidia bacterium]
MVSDIPVGIDRPQGFRSGFIAIVGRANVGKSTLLNAMLGQKLSIVSPKPHTTRHKLLGIINSEDAVDVSAGEAAPGFQAALLDTPGYLRGGRDQMDAAMTHELSSALSDADVVLLVVEPRPPGDVEQHLMEQIAQSGAPAVLCINKVDTVAKHKLLPVMQQYSEAHPFLEIVPVSGLEEDGVPLLLEALVRHLPEQEAIFPPELLTDRPVRFLAGEIVREKVFHLYGHEVPYDTAVEVDDYEERDEDRPDFIRAVIYVDKATQKQLLIGKGGQALKEVGVLARPEIEELVGKPVYLELWVKVSPKWRRKAGFIQRMM